MAGRRPRSFGRTVAYLAVFFVVASIAVAFFRNPFADRWVGDVYRTDGAGKLVSKIEGVQLKMDIVGSSAASMHWLNFGQSSRGVRYVFSGPNRHEMLKYGFRNEHLADDEGRAPANFQQGYCAFDDTSFVDYYVKLPDPVKVMNRYQAKAQFATRNDCASLNAGIQDFDQMAFVSGTGMKIGGHLERDSLMGPLMYAIVKFRFDDWNKNASF
jgi:hypothetical protein